MSHLHKLEESLQILFRRNGRHTHKQFRHWINQHLEHTRIILRAFTELILNELQEDPQE